MNKDNQSLLDFLQTVPLSSFMMRSPISNKEAQALYDIWLSGETDEYGKHIIPPTTDINAITELTSKKYIQNTPSRFATRDLMPVQTCEFTKKGKDVIQKIILHKEKSAFEKSSHVIDFETIWRAAEAGAELDAKTAAAQKKPQDMNWLERVAYEMDLKGQEKIDFKVS